MIWLYMAIFLVFYVPAARYQCHMLQLNGYKTKGHLKWLRANFPGWLYKPYLRRKAKKPLVYTWRVRRLILTLAALTAGALWAACPCMWPAMVLGAPVMLLAANLANRPWELAINYSYIWRAKRILKSMPGLTVIGITGSYGKTSVKHYLHEILSTTFNTLMTPESFNTPMGIVRTVREHLRPFHQFFVCEMGARHVGDIAELCRLAQPKHGILTAVGPQHLDTMKTIENITKTKFALPDSIPADGIVLLNTDSEIIRQRAADYKAVTYSTRDWDDSDYRARDIKTGSEGSTFFADMPGGRSLQCHTAIIGRHNVGNILAAIAMADKLGVPAEAIKKAVAGLKPVPHRLQLIKRDGLVIIDDAFNANESGVAAALETLAMFEGFKIVVTPGLVEMGAAQDEANRAFGGKIAQVADCVILMGAKQTQPIMAGLTKAGYPADKVFVAETLEQAFGRIAALDAGGRQKVALLANDLPDNF
ncbi:MAG: UDP-N-acetylmuramoyl-tripeptide--D-alanyl-D-alanine ligase [Alphaproteobacteria bacterium]|nr:UDP-N-acetylmuramoyl-tripeptide--D-alanyl-D-alanine ligase [Alphaproteobacteria bacterium]